MDLAAWAAGFCAAAGGFHFASLAVAAVRLRRRPAKPTRPGMPVSLIRPVCGLDNFAEETLASSFRLAYPAYELLFCVARGDDPVVPLVRRLIAAHPAVSARLLVGEQAIGGNPKLNNIAKGWQAARHRWIIIADSNVLLPPDAIERLLAGWRCDSGAVCSMPIGARPHNFWAELECAFLNTLQARVQYAGEALGFGFAQGKTMLLRRDIVDDAGGLRALTLDAAEDAATTKLVRQGGRRVHLVDQPFAQPLGWRTASEVWLRQLRWARLRRGSFPWLFLPEIMVGSVFPAAAALAAAGWGASGGIVVTALLVGWFGGEWGLARAAGWRCSWRLLAALALRDLMLPALWCTALIGSGFVWRGTAMTAGDGNPAGDAAAPAGLRPSEAAGRP